MEIYFRKLRIEDAKISYKWRNDPEIWKHTGRKWNNYVTKEIEEEWIKKVSEEKNSIRFAICVGNAKIYIGNVQLTDITEKEGIFHIFIGEKKYWGQGIGKVATIKFIDYIKNNMNINEIKLKVKKQNIAAIKIYEKCGFSLVPKKNDDEYYVMVLSL